MEITNGLQEYIKRYPEWMDTKEAMRFCCYQSRNGLRGAIKKAAESGVDVRISKANNLPNARVRYFRDDLVKIVFHKVA